MLEQNCSFRVVNIGILQSQSCGFPHETRPPRSRSSIYFHLRFTPRKIAITIRGCGEGGLLAGSIIIPDLLFNSGH